MSEIEFLPVSIRSIISFFIGFIIGAVVRRTVKSAVIISSYFAILLVYLDYVEIIEININRIVDWAENLVEYISSQSIPDEASPRYVTDPLSVFGGFIIGLISGYYIG